MRRNAFVAVTTVAAVLTGCVPAAPSLDPPGQADISDACEQVSHPASSTQAHDGITAMDPSGEYIAEDGPYLWHDGEKTKLVGIADINSSGVVAGNSKEGPWRYEDGEYTALQPPEGTDENVDVTAEAINENGDIVGAVGVRPTSNESNVVIWQADNAGAIELPDGPVLNDNGSSFDISDDGAVIATDHDAPVMWTSEGREDVSLPFDYWRVDSAMFAGDWVAVSTTGKTVEDAGTAWRLSDSDNKRTFDMEFHAIDAQGRGYGVIDNVPVRQDGDTFQSLPFPTPERHIFSKPLVTITAVSHDGSTVSGGIIDAGDGEKLINNVMWHCE